MVTRFVEMVTESDKEGFMGDNLPVPVLLDLDQLLVTWNCRPEATSPELKVAELTQEIRGLLKEGKITVHSVMATWTGSPFGAVEAIKMTDSQQEVDEIETKFSAAILDVVEILGNLQREDLYAFWREGKKDSALKFLVPLAKDTCQLQRKLHRITFTLEEYALQLQNTLNVFQAAFQRSSDDVMCTQEGKYGSGKGSQCTKFRRVVRHAWYSISGGLNEKKRLLPPPKHGKDDQGGAEGQRAIQSSQVNNPPQHPIQQLHVRPEVFLPERNKSDMMRFNNPCHCDQCHCAGQAGCGRSYQYARRSRFVPPPLTLEAPEHPHQLCCQHHRQQQQQQHPGPGHQNEGRGGHCKCKCQCQYEEEDPDANEIESDCNNRNQGSNTNDHTNNNNNASENKAMSTYRKVTVKDPPKTCDSKQESRKSVKMEDSSEAFADAPEIAQDTHIKEEHKIQSVSIISSIPEESPDHAQSTASEDQVQILPSNYIEGDLEKNEGSGAVEGNDSADIGRPDTFVPMLATQMESEPFDFQVPSDERMAAEKETFVEEVEITQESSSEIVPPLNEFGKEPSEHSSDSLGTEVKDPDSNSDADSSSCSGVDRSEEINEALNNLDIQDYDIDVSDLILNLGENSSDSDTNKDTQCSQYNSDSKMALDLSELNRKHGQDHESVGDKSISNIGLAEEKTHSNPAMDSACASTSANALASAGAYANPSATSIENFLTPPTFTKSAEFIPEGHLNNNDSFSVDTNPCINQTDFEISDDTHNAKGIGPQNQESILTLTTQDATNETDTDATDNEDEREFPLTLNLRELRQKSTCECKDRQRKHCSSRNSWKRTLDEDFDEMTNKEVVVVRSAVSAFAESEFGVMDLEDLDWLNRIKEMGRTGQICAEEIETAEKLKRQSIFMNCIKYRTDEVAKDVKSVIEALRVTERKWVDPILRNLGPAAATGHQGRGGPRGHRGNQIGEGSHIGHENHYEMNVRCKGPQGGQGASAGILGQLQLSQLVRLLHHYCTQLFSAVSRSCQAGGKSKHESVTNSVSCFSNSKLTETEREAILVHLGSLSAEATATHKSFKRFLRMVTTDTRFLKELCLSFPNSKMPDFQKHEMLCRQFHQKCHCRENSHSRPNESPPQSPPKVQNNVNVSPEINFEDIFS